MTKPQYDFYFEMAGRSATQGAIAPAEQFFEGSLAETSLARETGQNSIDARSGPGAVAMRFELADVATSDLPGIVNLSEHIAWVEKETRGSQGHARMLNALETIRKPTIPVLRISDYGTTGLTGSESRNENSSSLSALTRGAGISANDGTRGGSFGIGSAVGPMSSSMCTVLYTSLPGNRKDVVFAGHSRLASHRDSRGDWRQGEGFFTDTAIDEDFSYLRNPEQIGNFSVRAEPGTDVYILGYRNAEEDPQLENIKEAFLSHFLVAIHRGQLEVEGVGRDSTWQLNTTTLERFSNANSDTTAFYRAICDPNPVTADSNRFGRLALYVNVDDSLDKSLHTVTMRKPLIKIDTFKHTSIPAKYAAILECSDEIGNKFLRDLEPPQHDRWDPGRGQDGALALAELKSFVRDGLRARVGEQLGDTIEIKGLSRYLPAPSLIVSHNDEGSVPAGDDGESRESATVHGSANEPFTASLNARKSVNVHVQTPGTGTGVTPTARGKNRGGQGKRKSHGIGLPGAGTSGDGRAVINSGNVRFRSWSDQNSVLHIVLTANDDVQGDLELVALGQGGSVESDYLLPINDVILAEPNAPQTIAWSGNVLQDLALQANTPTHLRLTLNSDHRYRLDVK
ncbi:hypothetical protein [Cryobacterium sp. AP23]